MTVGWASAVVWSRASQSARHVPCRCVGRASRALASGRLLLASWAIKLRTRRSQGASPAVSRASNFVDQLTRPGVTCVIASSRSFINFLFLFPRRSWVSRALQQQQNTYGWIGPSISQPRTCAFPSTTTPKNNPRTISYFTKYLLAWSTVRACMVQFKCNKSNPTISQLLPSIHSKGGCSPAAYTNKSNHVPKHD
jgi:hypothetical protein